MNMPVKDCQCEDFPCCEHADNFPSEEPEYCECCGGYGHNGMQCEADWEDEEEAPEYDPGPQVDDVGGMSEVEWPMPIGSEEW